MKTKPKQSILAVIETWFLFLLLIVMIILSFANIIIRNTSGGGIVWADKLLISIVLWIAAVGGAAASAREEHITISVFSYYLSGEKARYLKIFRDTVSAAVSAMLAYYSFRLMMLEFSEHKEFIFFIETWMPMAILAPAFLLTAFRYVIRAIKNISPAGNTEE